jgi:murein DD-endopeptidase MepM/ murein hydrolase activator NlpD
VVTPRPAPAPARAAATASPAVDALAAGRGRFVWPVRGQVLSGFGPRGPGQRNDGLNIAAPVGESVRAAATGEVVYAGDQVPGFGKLVLLKHADGWVTAYAHLSDIGVKMRERVTQGQEIGKSGQTGSVTQPQLHFEVRHAPSPQDRARPVDPLPLLPPQ